jgi:hypothetical protein
MKDLPPEEIRMDAIREERRSFIRVVRELRQAGLRKAERRIELDKLTRRDAADALYSQRIRRHTLLDDNPCSG